MGLLKKDQVPVLIERLNRKHPDARYELDWETPLQLLIGTILAAQCTDERVNRTTPALFARYKDAKAYAEADRTELEELLKPTGFYRQKAKTVQEVCQALVANHKGEVPKTMADLVQLPGVARKTANVVLNNAFRIPSGVIVDTHVARVAPRMGLTRETKPEKIEKDLMQIIPQEEWVQFGPAMVLHGRYTCTNQEPKCGECVFRKICPQNGVTDTTAKIKAKPQPRTTTKASSKAATRATSAPAPTPAPEKKTSSKPATPTGLWAQIPTDWQQTLAAEASKPYFATLEKFVSQERKQHSVFPPAEDVFTALRATPFEKVAVILLGQDPYHDDGQAHGLAFSVRPGIKPPPSLVNMFKELKSDLGVEPPGHGCLLTWAQRGVLLLNTTLTVRAHEPASHAGHGWEQFTDAIIRALSASATPRVFLLWGGHAQKKESLIDTGRHRILKMAHPSPLSAKKFLGSKPYSQTNQLLKELGREPIDWDLGPAPDLTHVEAQPTAPRKAREARQELPPAPAALVDSGAALALDLALDVAIHQDMQARLPATWRKPLQQAVETSSFRALQEFLVEDSQKSPAIPSGDVLYRPLRATPWNEVRVVLLGEEPDLTTDGLAWSQIDGSERTVAQERLIAEACDDLGYRQPTTTSLESWAGRGVLLWNAIPTRRVARPGSHVGKGWEEFTRALLRALSQRPTPLVFVFLGPKLARYSGEIDTTRHSLVRAPHPEQDTFPGCHLFSRINEALELRGESGIWWQLPAI